MFLLVTAPPIVSHKFQQLEDNFRTFLLYLNISRSQVWQQRDLLTDSMFPFIDVNRADMARTADTIESVMRVRDVLAGHYQLIVSAARFEAVSLAVEYLKTNHALDASSKVFVDCLGSRGEAAIYASSFGFGRVVSVELTKKTLAQGTRLLENLRVSFPEFAVALAGVALDGGFFRQHPVESFDVLFLDVTCFRSTLMDEAALLGHFLDYSATAKAGSYVVLVTTAPALHLADYYDCPETAKFPFRLLLEADVGTLSGEGERQGSATVGIYVVNQGKGPEEDEEDAR